MTDYRAIPTGYHYEGQTNKPIAPTPGPVHQWVCTAIFSVSQASIDYAAAAWMAGGQEGLSLDHENLVTVQGPGCLKCSAPLTPQTYAQPCPVNVTVVHGPGCTHN